MKIFKRAWPTRSVPRMGTILGLLLASVSVGGTLDAGQTNPTATRKFPRRLPAVTAAETGQTSSETAPAVQPGPAQSEDAESIAAAPADGPPAIQPGQSGKPPTRWLRSTTSSAADQVARRLIAQATGEYRIGAWLSAEATAWDALRWAAQSIDLADHAEGDAGNATSQILQSARDAIREARDFAGAYGAVDGEAIVRMARSHRTDLLDDDQAKGLSATDASDRYLDQARVLLAGIASRSVEAAQAMDLLAAVYLSRADRKTLPSATALCLRRAALQGQPENASLASRLGMHLADVGLYQEARWVLEHSLLIRHDPQTADALVQVLRRTGQDEQANGLIAKTRSQADSTPQSQPTTPPFPLITELSPAEFAAISKPVMTAPRESKSVRASPAGVQTNNAPMTIASHRRPTDSASQSGAGMGHQDDAEPGMVRRWIRSLKGIW